MGDTKVLKFGDESRDGDTVAHIIVDNGTHWFQSYPTRTKNKEDTTRSMRTFAGPYKIHHFRSDNSGELQAGAKELDWPQAKAIPHDHESNSAMERHVRKVNEGTACCLGQSGLQFGWWKKAMKYFCFMSCVIDIVQAPAGNPPATAYKQRWKAEFDGPKIPFGAEVKYHPYSPKDKARIH